MSWIVVKIAVVVALVVLVLFMTSRKTKGMAGEFVLAVLLGRLKRDGYRVLNDVYLPMPDGSTSQIDHIAISQYGVFVIETKTYKGWIFGDADSKVWTQCLNGKGRNAKRYTFQNPIRQNYRHLCAIESCTGIPKDVMHSVIAFSGECTFKTKMPAEVHYFGRVEEYIRSFNTPIIKVEQVDEMATAIVEWQATLSREQKASHVKNLATRHDGVAADLESAPLCPYCGAPMVSRLRKSDSKPFYGCSKYPACKGIVNIR